MKGNYPLNKKNWNKLKHEMGSCQIEEQKIPQAAGAAAQHPADCLSAATFERHAATKGIFFLYSITSQSPRHLRPHSVWDAWKK